MYEVCDIVTSYQSLKFAEYYLKYKERPRTIKPIVKWYFGKSGRGKSYAASQELGLEGVDYYRCMPTGRWFEGYDGHKKILVDDMRKDFMPFHTLLQFIDRYGFRVETKGASRQLQAEIIIITSCFSPEELYNTREDIEQLTSRIDEVKEFTGINMRLNSQN